VLLKRGNTVQSRGYTGPLGELTYDTDLGTVRVHNNIVAGGVNILATQAQINLINANLASAVSTIGNSISTITGIDAIFVANINTLLANAAVQSVAIGNLQAFQTYANATFGTSSYGNANVAAYLVANPQGSTYGNANVESYFGANLGSLWSNAATQATGINTITANLGAYQTYANANAATQAGTITTLQTQVYANANVATYLPTYSGNIAANIFKNGYTWRFGTDGDLTLPRQLLFPEGTTLYNNGMTVSANIGYAIRAYGNTGGADLQWFGNTNIGTTKWNAVRLNSPEADAEGTIVLSTGQFVASKNWEFRADGTTTLPAGGVISEDGGISGAIRLTPAGGANANQALVIYPTANPDGDHVHLTAGGGSTELYLGDDSHYVKLVDGGNVEIRTNDSITSTAAWNFSTDGNLTLPQTNMHSSPQPVSYPGITFTDGTFQTTAYTGSTYSDANVASYLVANPQASTYGNANVAAYLTRRTSLIPGVTLAGNIFAGPISGSAAEPGFRRLTTTDLPDLSANISSYLPTYSGNISANVVKNGYTWTFGSDGNLTLPTNGDIIMPGINSILSVSGTTLLGGYSQVTGYYSTLGISYPGAGTQHGMTLRPAADNTTAINFLNASGNSVGNITQTASTVKFTGDGSGLSNVAIKTTGSWTVTTGTNTYSFTVPPSGVYQLWVECNIPNGILAYNAIATLTNTNVPVVGAQYAWVYTGGGTPIDFTSIPNQFTGTGNAIVRSSVAPSATTNRFDFGINNTSGSSQTAQWGYVRID
jgi:hypothetical protein